MLQVNSLKFSHNIFIRQLTHWALNEKMIIHSFKFKVQVNLNYRREWNRANRCLLDFSSQLGMAMNFTESYLQKLWLVHYEYREFDWGAVCKMVPESSMFLRYYKGSFPSIEIVMCQIAVVIEWLVVISSCTQGWILIQTQRLF